MSWRQVLQKIGFSMLRCYAPFWSVILFSTNITGANAPRSAIWTVKVIAQSFKSAQAPNHFISVNSCNTQLKQIRANLCNPWFFSAHRRFPLLLSGKCLDGWFLQECVFYVAVRCTFVAVCIFVSTNISGANAPLYSILQIFHLLNKRQCREIFVENQQQN